LAGAVPHHPPAPLTASHGVDNGVWCNVDLYACRARATPPGRGAHYRQTAASPPHLDLAISAVRCICLYSTVSELETMNAMATLISTGPQWAILSYAIAPFVN